MAEPWDSYNWTDGERLKARHFRLLWENMQELKFPRSNHLRVPFAANATTTSATFVNVTNYALTFYTTGRRLWIFANPVSYASAGDTEGYLDMALDGVSLTGGNGYARVNWQAQPDSYPFSFMTEPVSAGEHTIQLMHRRSTGTDTVQTYRGTRHWLSVIEV